MSSDFFGNLRSGFRMPDARINGGGPLPTSLSGPAGINGDPDGKINFNSDLLSGITPYADAKGGRMGSDRNYQQIPCRVQQIIPMLYLPRADARLANEQLVVSHPVDQGDVAFVINTDNVNRLIRPNVMQNAPLRQEPGRSAFCNLPTLNYILSGLQRLKPSDNLKTSSWARMAYDLGYDWQTTDPVRKRQQLTNLISTRLMPYGICAGSEKQGGQHETGLSPVQAACNFVITMTVDGQNRDLVNFWRGTNISAGDQLIYRLQYVPTKRFTLNHYFKEMVHESFPDAQSCWLMVPDRFSIIHNPQKSLNQKYNTEICDYWKDYDYRLDGYWRVAQTFQHRNSHDEEVENYCNDMCFMRGQLLQVTFAPAWIYMGSKKRKRGGSNAISASTATAAVKRKSDTVDVDRFMNKQARFKSWTKSAASVAPNPPLVPMAISSSQTLAPHHSIESSLVSLAPESDITSAIIQSELNQMMPLRTEPVEPTTTNASVEKADAIEKVAAPKATKTVKVNKMKSDLKRNVVKE